MILREVKEIKERMMREMKNEDLLIVILIIEKKVVKWKRWDWE